MQNTYSDGDSSHFCTFLTKTVPDSSTEDEVCLKLWYEWWRVICITLLYETYCLDFSVFCFVLLFKKMSSYEFQFSKYFVLYGNTWSFVKLDLELWRGFVVVYFVYCSVLWCMIGYRFTFLAVLDIFLAVSCIFFFWAWDFFNVVVFC